ncbi:hypothetical protein [Janibacter sp. G56]|uniref:hypothetical protein n=1 Tax=Janibacter sp. G56 TaxID=3418717 RepID=UPI003D085545
MSTASRLFAGLIDDAAVFPPRGAGLEVAVREHLALRSGLHADRIGPLLVPAGDAAAVVALAAADARTDPDGIDAGPLELGLIVRPGAPTAPLREGARALEETTRVRLSSIETGWSPQWRDLLDLGVPLAIEVGLGADQEKALDDLADARDQEGVAVLAKFRTGATPLWDWPDEGVLAGFLAGAVARGLTVKLTGGLHHLVRADRAARDVRVDRADRDVADREPMHGVLNVLLAVDAALAGADRASVAGILALDASATVLELTLGLVARPEDVARARATFVSYGCCDVLDPLTEAIDLGLLPRPTTTGDPA